MNVNVLVWYDYGCDVELLCLVFGYMIVLLFWIVVLVVSCVGFMWLWFMMCSIVLLCVIR